MDTAVGLVKSHLELCGYFVLAELPLRAPDGGGYRDVTDLDIIAVRFPHRPSALPRRVIRPLEVFLDTDPALGTIDDGIDVIVGEVKEGKAQLNRPLQRVDTIAFTLRRVGCCPEEYVGEEAQRIARDGSHTFSMPGGMPCRLRLVVFAGRESVDEPGVLTIPLAHCAEFIRRRLGEARDVLAGIHFKDPILGLYALEEKLAQRDGAGSGTRN